MIAAAITSSIGKHPLSTHIHLDNCQHGLRSNSVVLLEQIRTIDRSRLREYIGHLNEQTLEEVNQALAVSFGLEVAPEPVHQMCQNM